MTLQTASLPNAPTALQIIDGWPSTGEPFTVDRALARHPEAAGDKSIYLELAFHEYCLLPPDRRCREEFLQRHPGVRHSLSRLIRCYESLRGNSDLAALVAPLEWPDVGSEWLGFWLEALLGRGAFSRVYLARERSVGNRAVVVKAADRVDGEIERLARLQHPHIVPIHSVRHDPRTGLSAICMPVLGRRTLLDLLDELAEVDASAADDPVRRASPASLTAAQVTQVVRWGAEIAEALACAHAAGYCHGDVKPSNILLADDGRAVLLDFNLAFDRDATPTGGTPGYMPPEKLAGTEAPGELGDIYALGVTLYEALGGRHPFAPLPARLPETARVLLERQRAGAVPLRQVNPRIDRRTAAVIDACLAFAPERRPASADRLARQLRRALTPTRRFRRVCRFRPRLTAAALAAVLAVASAIGAWEWQRPPAAIRALEAGWRAQQSGDHAAAVGEFTRALALDPALADARFSRGISLVMQHEYRAALEDFAAISNSATTRQPGCVDPRFAAARGYCFARLNGRFADAVKWLELARSHGFQSVELDLAIGVSRLNTGDLDGATAILERLVAEHPEQRAARHALIACQLKKFSRAKRPEHGRALLLAAVGQYQLALRMGPCTADLRMLGQSLEEEARSVDASLDLPPLPEMTRDAQRLDWLANPLAGLQPPFRLAACPE